MNTEPTAPETSDQAPNPPSTAPKTSHGFYVVLIVIVAFIGALYVGSHWMKGLQVIQQGSSAPAFTLTDVMADSRQVTLADYRSKLVLIHFFASWCPTCKEEIPSLKLLNDKYASSGLTIIGMDMDNDIPTARQFLRSFGITFTALWDQDGKIAQTYGTFKIPESYLVGPDGTIIRKFIGSENWQDSRIEAIITSALSKLGAR